MRAYLIPIRNDLNGMNLQVTDLVPNTSQRNSSFDGVGQSGYIGHGSDLPGLTVVSGDSYVSGSRNTLPLVALDHVGTTGGADDASITTVAKFGLLAYIQDRIQAAPLGAGDVVSPAEAVTISSAIATRANSGLSLTVADINTILTAAVGSTLTLGASFGTVEEIIRILAGEVYRVRANTIIATEVPVFLSLANRAVLVAAGTAATYYSSGAFLTESESGYNGFTIRVKSGALVSSCLEGQLHKMTGTHAVAIKNPAFAYTAGEVNALRPRATDAIAGAIPATGLAVPVRVYDSLGNIFA